MRGAIDTVVCTGVAAAMILAPASARGFDTTALLARYAPVLQLYSADLKPSAIEPFASAAAGGFRMTTCHAPPL